jgi:hypothetical protein
MSTIKFWRKETPYILSEGAYARKCGGKYPVHVVRIEKVTSRTKPWEVKSC